MNFIWIPIAMTVVMLIAMFRPLESNDNFLWGLELLFRGFWAIPILVTWVVFLAAVVIAGQQP